MSCLQQLQPPPARRENIHEASTGVHQAKPIHLPASPCRDPRLYAVQIFAECRERRSTSEWCRSQG
eukprot:1282508-Amphidinium_carterae.1